jgi:hypothetical protein
MSICFVLLDSHCSFFISLFPTRCVEERQQSVGEALAGRERERIKFFLLDRVVICRSIDLSTVCRF